VDVNDFPLELINAVQKTNLAPFDGHKRIKKEKFNFNYFVKVIPNRFFNDEEVATNAFQFSLNSRERVI